jgi:tetraacyldisaccharide 4'-kinase
VPGALEELFRRIWWTPRPGAASRLLQPLAALYGVLQRRHARRSAPAAALAVPVLVVGNVVVGGAGKTPTVIAVVAWLARCGHRPGIVSRGHGRAGSGPRLVVPADSPCDVGDEPLLLTRRSGVPMVVGRDRVAAARLLLEAHPDVDVIVADDGLQHHALPRRAELLVFDERGAGNGLLLPAGPLREPLPRQLAAGRHLLYTAGAASTPLPGAFSAPGRLPPGTRATPHPPCPWQRCRAGPCWPPPASQSLGNSSPCFARPACRSRRCRCRTTTPTPRCPGPPPAATC